MIKYWDYPSLSSSILSVFFLDHYRNQPFHEVFNGPYSAILAHNVLARGLNSELSWFEIGYPTKDRVSSSFYFTHRWIKKKKKKGNFH